jgi:hypothetical protein
MVADDVESDSSKTSDSDISNDSLPPAFDKPTQSDR